MLITKHFASLFSVVTTLSCFTFLVKGQYMYNMINCQADLWCYQENDDYNGVPKKVCERIDPLQPNYHERGYLQIVNYARLFNEGYKQEYGKTFDSTCENIAQIHPLWEQRGATEYSHFNSVQRRECSYGLGGSHDTCKDFCYDTKVTPPQDMTNTDYRPITDCTPKGRKGVFEWFGFKLNSWNQINGNKKVQFNAEAICNKVFPCGDPGHCGIIMSRDRMVLGVGRAMDTGDASKDGKISTYMNGIRNYELSVLEPDKQHTETTNLLMWKKHESANAFHRIPSGSHWDKCTLYGGCNTQQWQTIYFQMTYAHYNDEFDAGTAFVVVDNVPHAMTVKESYVTTSTSQYQLSNYNWAIFDVEMPWPAAAGSCSKYHFIISSNGVEYRLPQDSNLQYATTGNGCEVNHYTGNSENCPGESPFPDVGGPAPAVVTSSPTEAPTETWVDPYDPEENTDAPTPAPISAVATPPPTTAATSGDELQALLGYKDGNIKGFDDGLNCKLFDMTNSGCPRGLPCNAYGAAYQAEYVIAFGEGRADVNAVPCL